MCVCGMKVWLAGSHSEIFDANCRRFSSMSGRDDAMVAIVAARIVMHLEWPQGRPTPAPIAEGAMQRTKVMLLMVSTCYHNNQ